MEVYIRNIGHAVLSRTLAGCVRLNAPGPPCSPCSRHPTSGRPSSCRLARLISRRDAASPTPRARSSPPSLSTGALPPPRWLWQPPTTTTTTTTRPRKQQRRRPRRAGTSSTPNLCTSPGKSPGTSIPRRARRRDTSKSPCHGFAVVRRAGDGALLDLVAKPLRPIHQQLAPFKGI